MYHVPLWHSELHYDLSNNETLVVNCIPDLPSHIWIDEYNNLYISIKKISDIFYMRNYQFI